MSIEALTSIPLGRITGRITGRVIPIFVALALSACAESGLETGSLQVTEAPSSWAPETTKGDKPAISKTAIKQAEAPLHPETAAAIRDARSLKQAGNKARALGLLEKTDNSDKDPALLLERGLLTLEMGQIDKAAELLKSAHNPSNPDWRQHSALGAAFSAKGQQQAAQAEFAKALQLAPENTGVLNNLALSYALDGKHAEAERLLRKVAENENDGPKAKQNLALILGLRGNIAEARTMSEAVLPPDKAKQNVATLERLTKGNEQVSRAEPDEETRELIRAARAAGPEPSGDSPFGPSGDSPFGPPGATN